MELQRGICSLCAESTRVLTSSDAEEFSKLLPEILYENFLPNSEFQKIKNLIKICVICCFKIQTAAERKTVIAGIEKNEVIVKEDFCHFCKADRCLMKISNNWKYFTDRTEGYVSAVDFPLCACPKCLFFFDVIYNFKTKLRYKFPQLAIQKKRSGETPQKQNDTPKRKSLSKSPPSSTKRKIFDNCFTYLQPLCNNNYHIDEKLKKDIKLYKKIAYVNVKNLKDIDVKETPKMRPVIKIKLKPKHRRSETSNGKPVIKLTRSEEMPSKSGQSRSRKRRHSHIEKTEASEGPEEKLQETPKAASIESLVPKRRVSLYIENTEKENEKQKEEEKEDEERKEEEKENEQRKEEETSKETITEVERNSEETATEEKPNSPEELETESEGIVDVHKNGTEEPRSENAENVVSPIAESTDNIVNGEKLEEAAEIVEEGEKEKAVFEENVEDTNLSDSSKSTPRKSPPKSDSGGEGSDSDHSDKDRNKDASESDVLNGSERKKKRVTFSDEIND